MERPISAAELQLTSRVAQYVNEGNPSQAVREARTDRLERFLAKPGDYIPTKYVAWWLIVAFLLGTQWRVFLSAFHP